MKALHIFLIGFCLHCILIKQAFAQNGQVNTCNPWDCIHLCCNDQDYCYVDNHKQNCVNRATASTCRESECETGCCVNLGCDKSKYQCDVCGTQQQCKEQKEKNKKLSPQFLFVQRWLIILFVICCFVAIPATIIYRQRLKRRKQRLVPREQSQEIVGQPIYGNQENEEIIGQPVQL